MNTIEKKLTNMGISHLIFISADMSESSFSSGRRDRNLFRNDVFRTAIFIDPRYMYEEH